MLSAILMKKLRLESDAWWFQAKANKIVVCRRLGSQRFEWYRQRQKSAKKSPPIRDRIARNEVSSSFDDEESTMPFYSDCTSSMEKAWRTESVNKCTLLHHSKRFQEFTRSYTILRRVSHTFNIMWRMKTWRLYPGLQGRRNILVHCTHLIESVLRKQLSAICCHQTISTITNWVWDKLLQ